ncbi:MAG: hypothetical protein QNJ13_02750 [Paracoccaceae bacterium]|nr:hypothetical protein [Paracoccaceae bacterium]
MGSNILPFAVRRAAPLPSRPPAARLILASKTVRLALTIAPRRAS